MSHRIEEDTLGQVTLPADALYGAQTARAIQNFPISGRTAHPELILAYLRVKKAAARANAKCGVLDQKVAQLIEQAADQIESESALWPDYFPVDPYQAGAGTSQNMNVNEVLANTANRLNGGTLGKYVPVHPNDHVNRSQSTNDSFPTAMRLAILDASRGLVETLRSLADSFENLGTRTLKLPKSARTHLQDAVPITLGQEFHAYAATLRRCETWIQQARSEVSELGIGGSAAGTGLNVPEKYPELMIQELNRLSSEKLRLASDLREAMQSQAPVTFYSSMLRVLALELTRICNDLRLLSSGPLTGLSEITLPAVQPGSSIMPGKVNPSILEMANQAFFSALGMDHAIALSAQAGQLELNVMMPIMAHSCLEATHIMTNTIGVLRERCVDGIVPNDARLRRYFESTPQVATALSPKLGYDQTAALVKEAIETGRSVIELVRERKLVEERELRKLLDVEKLTGLNRIHRN